MKALGLSGALSKNVVQVERMGDSKQQVREESKNVLLTLFEVGVTSQRSLAPHAA